jgi:tetratricopeptide (TPR) repeat protein
MFAGVPAMPPHFVGRDGVVGRLVERLTTGQEYVIALDGLPGVGKTTLAVALAHHRHVLNHFSDGVLWASLGPQGDPFTALAHWAQAFGKDISSLSELEDRHEEVKRLIGQRHLLLVIDDVWDIQAARALQCGGPNCCHLLTSREQGIAVSFAGRERASKLPALEDDAAFQLLRELAPEACETNPAEARQLSDSLGGLPLALDLVGGFLAAPERSLFPELSQAALEEMAHPRRRLELASVRLGARRAGEVSLKQTILFSLETLTEEARTAFYALGAFAPKPERFSLQAAQAVTNADVNTLALLVARNLLEIMEKAGQELAMHQTIADAARTLLPPEAVARHREYYLALVNGDREDWRRIEPVYGQVQWAWGNSHEEGDLLDWVRALGLYQRRRGLWQDQVAWVERGLRVAEALGLSQVQGALLNNMGVVYSDTGQPQKALELYGQALPILREVGDRAVEAATLNNMGAVYLGTGQPQKALELYGQALPISQEVGDRAVEAATLNHMASVYRDTGQPQKALELYGQALPISQEVGDRAGEAATLSNMGWLYNDTGQPKKALELCMQALPILREVGDRAGEATTLSNMASVCSDIGQPQVALELCMQALPILREVGDRAGEATTLNNLGLVYHATGQPQKALELYGQALPILREVGDRVGEAVTRFNLAVIYREQKRLEEAAAELRLVVELFHQMGHPDLESVLSFLQQVEGELKWSG